MKFGHLIGTTCPHIHTNFHQNCPNTGEAMLVLPDKNEIKNIGCKNH